MGKKISIFAPFPPYSGGMSTLGLTLYDAFINNGHKVIKQQTESGLKGLLPIPYLYIQFIRTIYSSDIVHIISASGNALWVKDLPIIIISRLFNKKVVLNFVGGKAIDEFETWSFIKRMPFYLTNIIIVPTKILKNKIKNFDARLIVKTIPHMVGIKKFNDYKVKNKSNHFILLIAKAIENYSGHEILIDVFIEVQKTFQDIELWIAGSGKNEHKLKEKIINNRYKNIFFLGDVPNDDMPEIMNKSTLLIHGTRYESFGISLVEAMASSVPVIAFKVGGIPEVVKDRETGYLIPFNKKNLFAKTVVDLLKNKTKLEKMKKDSFHHSKKFNPDIVYKIWNDLYSTFYYN